MTGPAEYVSHLQSDDGPVTACGERWQGWQAPDRYAGPTSTPHTAPRPHEDEIRLCGACLKVATA